MACCARRLCGRERALSARCLSQREEDRCQLRAAHCITYRLEHPTLTTFFRTFVAPVLPSINAPIHAHVTTLLFTTFTSLVYGPFRVIQPSRHRFALLHIPIHTSVHHNELIGLREAVRIILGYVYMQSHTKRQRTTKHREHRQATKKAHAPKP